MTNLMGSNPGHDWPEGNYACRCSNCSEHYTGPKRSYFCYKCDTARREAPAPDYEAIRNAKIDMLKRFEEAKRICEAAGYVVYKKI